MGNSSSIFSTQKNIPILDENKGEKRFVKKIKIKVISFSITLDLE